MNNRSGSKSGSQSVTSASSELEEESISGDDAIVQSTWPGSRKGKAKLPGNLTDYEKIEQKGYRQIYFSGLPMKKKPVLDTSHKDSRCFDDANGYYKAYVGDHIAYRYEILEESGKGNFSQVFRAKDHRAAKRNKKCCRAAIKIMRDQTPDHLRLIYREAGILKYIRRADQEDFYGILRLHRSFNFRGHMCFITEELYMDLYTYMKKHEFAPLDRSLVLSIAAQVLRSLDFLSALGIIHADLKPENIMFCSPKSTAVKLVDFTWSWVADRDQVFNPDYFQSRFHRAPEVTLGGPLTPGIDMWSYGCVVAELAAGLPLFAGDDRHDQLATIVEVLGLPPVEVMEWNRSPLYFTDERVPYYCYELDVRMGDGVLVLLAGSLTDVGEVRGVPGSKHIANSLFDDRDSGYGPDFFDFLLRCFQWLPDDRWTPMEAGMHTWISAEYESLNRGEHKAANLTTKLKHKSGGLRNLFARKRFRNRSQRTAVTFGTPNPSRGQVPNAPSASSVSARLQRADTSQKKAMDLLKELYGQLPIVAPPLSEAPAKTVALAETPPPAIAQEPHASPVQSPIVPDTARTALSDRESERSKRDLSEIGVDTASPFAKAAID